MAVANFETEIAADTVTLFVRGSWKLACGLEKVEKRLQTLPSQIKGQRLIIDLSDTEAIDSAGAMMLQRLKWRQEVLSADNAGVNFIAATARHNRLLELAARYTSLDAKPPERPNELFQMLERLGHGVEDAGRNALAILSFLGAVLTTMVQIIGHPRRLRMPSMVHHMSEVGLNAFLIVGLMSFLIGAVIAFMGAQILEQFNAEVFTVELIGISVLREFGVLLTSILIAGRSGSAFTAQIGSMKLREEVDAMSAIGISVLEALVIPRIFALVIMMPVLVFLADMLGILGGGLVVWLTMDISPAFFLTRMQDTVTIENFWVGMIKAPFFAFVIAIIGCFQGMSVANSAEDLGRRTTRAVVEALFMVILVDALFAIFFLEIGF